MDLGEALREIWVAIDDLAMLASALEPEDQLDDDEVASGATDRSDRYDLETAAAVLNRALRAAVEFDDAVHRIGEPVETMVGVEVARASRALRSAFTGFVPEPCRGCPCIEQGGSPCCFCGGAHA